MSSLALIAAMLVSGASPPAVLKLAAPSLTLRGVDDATGAYYLEQLGQAFAERGAKVITARDIQQVVGMERQKALAGCADDHCLAELGAALGVDALLTGSVGKLEKSLLLTVKVLDPRSGSALASFSARADGEERLLDAMGEAADQMLPEVTTALRRSLGPRKPVSKAAPQGIAWIPLAGGAVLGAAGAGLLVAARADHDALVDPAVPLTQPEGEARRDRGAVLQLSGVACLGAGVLAAGAGLLWPLVAPKAPAASVAVVPLRGGGALATFSGALP